VARNDQAQNDGSELFDTAASKSKKTSGSVAVRSRQARANLDITSKSADQSGPASGLKKNTIAKARALDMPPTPRGCEWRVTDGGWNLFRNWKEENSLIGKKVKKERYAGHLSREAWEVMKEYDYETFIAVIAQRFRRHGGR
jgi:hypothetical protein